MHCVVLLYCRTAVPQAGGLSFAMSAAVHYTSVCMQVAFISVYIVLPYCCTAGSWAVISHVSRHTPHQRKHGMFDH
jgi:hypothetical protein